MMVLSDHTKKHTESRIFLKCQLKYGIQLLQQSAKHSSMSIQLLSSQNNLIKSSQNNHPCESSIIQPRTLPLKQCRICLSHNHQEQSVFLSPCKCSGSIKYVHQLCLKRWIEQKLLCINQQDNCQKTIECELCKTKIPFHINHKNQCRNCIEIKEQIKSKNYQFAVYLLCFIISIFLLAISVYYFVKILSNGFPNTQNSAKTTCICTFTLCVITFVMSIYNLRRFFIKKRAELILKNRQ